MRLDETLTLFSLLNPWAWLVIDAALVPSCWHRFICSSMNRNLKIAFYYRILPASCLFRKSRYMNRFLYGNESWSCWQFLFTNWSSLNSVTVSPAFSKLTSQSWTPQQWPCQCWTMRWIPVAGWDRQCCSRSVRQLLLWPEHKHNAADENNSE